MSEEGEKEGGLRSGIPEDGSAQQNYSTALAFYSTSVVIVIKTVYQY